MKLFLGSCVWREETVPYSTSMRQLVRELDKRNIPFLDATVSGDALISRARSIAASAFLRSDADILLSIDSDMFFTAEDAIKLCERALEFKLISALYMTRSLQTQPALMLLPGQRLVFAANSEPVEAVFASTGFMAVHREVFEMLKEDLPLCHQGWQYQGIDTSFYPFYMPFTIPWEVEGHLYLSEDWAFCRRAKDKGFKVWLDPSIRLGHMGDYMFTLEDLIRAPRSQPVPLILYREANGLLKTEPVPSKLYIPTFTKVDTKIAQGGKL